MQVWDNVHCQGIGCLLWRPSGSTSFAWQARDNVCAAKEWDICTGATQAPPLLRGRREPLYIAKGSDVRRGVPRVPHLLRGRHGAMCIAGGVCVAGVGHCAQCLSF